MNTRISLKSSATIMLLLLFLSFSCNNKSDNTDSFIINVDIAEAQELNYDAWFDSYTIVPLETNDESIIGEIGKICITDSYIIIFDQKTSQIKLFDKTGKYVRSIGKKGTGPNEYIDLNDIGFDKNTQLIYAHERVQNKMFIYDLSGKFISKSERAKFFLQDRIRFLGVQLFSKRQ